MDYKEHTLDSSVEEALPAYDVRYTYSDYIQWNVCVKNGETQIKLI